MWPLNIPAHGDRPINRDDVTAVNGIIFCAALNGYTKCGKLFCLAHKAMTMLTKWGLPVLKDSDKGPDIKKKFNV